MNDFLQRILEKKEKVQAEFSINKTSYTAKMKTFTRFEEAEIMTLTEMKVIGLLSHKLYENNRAIIIDDNLKEYIFTKMKWDINNRNNNNSFRAILGSLHDKNLLTLTKEDRVVINPVIDIIGDIGFKAFVTATYNYYAIHRIVEKPYRTVENTHNTEVYKRTMEIYKADIELIANQKN